MRRNHGFTLLEILISLSIISILAVIAVPIYLDYEVQARITEGFVVADPVKNMVMEYYETNGTWPGSNAAAALDAPASFKTNYVDAITITYSIPALGANNTIILTPNNVAGNFVKWSCQQGTVANKFRPASCRS